ncbi:MAG: AMP-binding protein [Bacteroidales bacterium]|nr:AMP-binding protein [Bacteroidales bacterium]
MGQYIAKTLADLFEYSVKEYADNVFTGLSDGSPVYTYAQFGEKTREISNLMTSYGIGAKDRVVILSENMPNYAVVMFAITTFGRVMVPVLPDCSENEVSNILTHSDTKAVFASTAQLSKITKEHMDALSLVVNMSTFEVVKGELFEKEVSLSTPKPDDMVAILYTSGTSGNAKGVMLCHRNLCHNLVGIPDLFVCGPGFRFLSILPIAHTYEMSIGLLFPMASGASIYYLGKTPTPSALLAALSKVRPNGMCSVPLVIEKIYRKSVLKTIESSKVLKFLRALSPKILYSIIGKRLRETFGGCLEVVAIGGAKVDPEVEAFLQMANFPYLIGYGLTETAPLVCANKLGKKPIGQTGPHVRGVQIRIDNPDPETGRGELVVYGPNVMMGYYKDPERTKDAFTKDGWFRTKDLARLDKAGNVYITGRLGNMILGASGENIYPEEIEIVINAIEGVEESIVKSERGRLVAIVKLADGKIDWDKESEKETMDEILSLKNSIKNRTNKLVNKASQIGEVRFIKEPFVKTATQKIRRFLY